MQSSNPCTRETYRELEVRVGVLMHIAEVIRLSALLTRYMVQRVTRQKDVVGATYLPELCVLLDRVQDHDASKLKAEEWNPFYAATIALAAAPLGTPEYQQVLEEFNKVLDKHYVRNEHHPEHFPNGIKDMFADGQVISFLIEMCVDIYASSRVPYDDVITWDTQIKYLIRRFDISSEEAAVIDNMMQIIHAADMEDLTDKIYTMESVMEGSEGWSGGLS